MLKWQKRIPDSYLIAVLVILATMFSASAYAQYNGECWAVDYLNVFKIGSSGQPTQISGFNQPLSLTVNSTDGSCWIADTDAVRVKKLSASGQELLTIDGIKLGFTSQPASVAVDATDGSCWIALRDSVYKFSSDGKQLSKIGGFNEPIVAVNPKNSECWVADSSSARVVRLSSAGKQLQAIQIEGVTQPKSISINPVDGSCWVLDAFTQKAVKLSSDGKILLQTTANTTGTAMMSTCIAAALDGGCWIGVMIDTMNDKVVKLGADGKVAVSAGGFGMPSGLATDPRDGGVWVADTNGGRIVKISASGQQVANIGGLTYPKAVAVGYTAK